MTNRHETILIVDDTPQNIRMLMETLKDAYKIIAAKSGEKALELIYSESRPDLILLDIVMPGMDGYEVCKRLKADKTTDSIPIIFITGKTNVEDETRGLALGAVDYITKPFSPAIVKARVRSQLTLSQSIREIQRKSEKVRNLLDNAGQGFLSFQKDLCIEDEYSQECQIIFGQAINGRCFPELICSNNSQQETLLKKALQEIFASSGMRQQVLLSLLPGEIKLNHQTVKVEYKMLSPNENERHYKMMVILTDISEKRLLENRMEAERNLLRMVVRSVIDYNDFLALKEDYGHFVTTEALHILDSDAPVGTRVFEIFRKIHTFKGLFSQMDMVHIVKKLHDFETAIDTLRKNSLAEAELELRRHFANPNMTSWLDPDLEKLQQILGKAFFDRRRILTIEPQVIQELEREITTRLPNANSSWLVERLRRLRYRPLHTLLKSYPEYVARLAQRMEKSLGPMVIEGDDVLIDPDRFGGVTKSLVHIFRNIIDHGIEPEDLRLQRGKNPNAQIICTICLKNHTIHLTIADDGKGIDVGKIRQAAIDLGILNKAETARLSDEETLQLIFRPDFSTREKVDEISGRGIGLAAVKQELTKIGGTVTVASAPGVGTTFEFLIPHMET